MVGSIDPRCETVRGIHWPKKGREVVWSSRRGSHLGQRSKATASTGRTYGCKRSDQTLKELLWHGGRPHMKTPDPGAFPSGRHFAAWLGLTPKDHSTAGKTRLGKITRAGDEVLRSLLVAGATAVIQQMRRGRGRPSPWLLALLKRKPPKLAAVALANKIARIAWKLMATGESYDGARMLGASALAA